MKINRLELKNFSSYEGVCEFDFKIDDKNKNIILIGGKNGAGKSSLFQSVKLSLYGPLSFSYQGTNAMYFSRIKELINHNAFTQDIVEAYVKLDFELFEDREYIQYTIKRIWRFVNQKIGEKCEVYKNGMVMSDDDVDFFQNYLQSLLPINLFEFYFFDGEQIADFFSTSNYSSYLKNALLTMCSIDTFELIRKYSVNYVQKNNGDIELENAQKEYEDCIDNLTEEEKQIVLLETKISKANDEIEDLIVEKGEIEKSFFNAGGLSEEEKNDLNNKLKYYEEIKADANVKIRSFIDNLLPFIITGGFAPKVKNQLFLENEIHKHYLIQSKLDDTLNAQVIKECLLEQGRYISDFAMEEFAILLTNKIKEKIRPLAPDTGTSIIHDLSEEQKNKLLGFIDSIEKFDASSILSVISEKQNAIENTVEINKKLRMAIDEQDIKEYTDKINDVNSRIFIAKQNLIDLQEKLVQKKEEIEKNITLKKTLLELLKSKTQNKSVYELTQKISSVMEQLVTDISKSKFKQLEEGFTEILKVIMRKENIIDYVVIDDKFNFFMYQRQQYTLSELLKLMINIGYEELEKRIGTRGLEKLFERYGVSSLPDLKKYIIRNMDDYIDLYKKVEFNQLSKGEKQLFILSLYWAIIKISNQDIPFIIDTPYARIDTEHREQISKIFFPGISSQVLIFSTDEEINQYYYKVIKPFIGQEYLLQNDEESNMTTVSKGYFFEE